MTRLALNKASLTRQTRQLKSYVRKGGTAVEAIDAKDAISNALSMMEPQLRRRDLRIVTLASAAYNAGPGAVERLGE